jgi:hypothetical protein
MHNAASSLSIRTRKFGKHSKYANEQTPKAATTDSSQLAFSFNELLRICHLRFVEVPSIGHPKLATSAAHGKCVKTWQMSRPTMAKN